MHSESEYKGNPILELMYNDYDKYPMKFGVAKARLILENLDAIKEFVESHEDD